VQKSVFAVLAVRFFNCGLKMGFGRDVQQLLSETELRKNDPRNAALQGRVTGGWVPGNAGMGAG
jgi:hypothetical protein